jgi:riboflavin kinase/FMN adenylyltransferase
MTYIGTRPTVNTGARLIETHIFDFDGDLYGQTLSVDFFGRLRGDQTFEGVDALVAQLKNDEQASRTYFTQKNSEVLV